jgi:4-nitrophenyl phosphatase
MSKQTLLHSLNNWATVRSLADKYDYFLFDCDGVLWNPDGMIGQCFRNIEWLESIGKKCYFITNNAMYSRESMAYKMQKPTFGYSANIENLYPSSTIAC